MKAKSYELKYPDVWLGEFIVKGQRVPVKLNYVGGNINIAVASLPKGLAIRINHQVSPENFPSFKTRNCCLLSALPFGRTMKEKLIQMKILKKLFSRYIKSKDSTIGMTILPSGRDRFPCKVYVVTPSEATSKLVVRYAPDWYHTICDQLHFIVMISI